MTSSTEFPLVLCRWKHKDYPPKEHSLWEFVRRYENVSDAVLGAYKPPHSSSKPDWREYRFFVDELAKSPAQPDQLKKLEKLKVSIPAALTFSAAVELITTASGARPLTPTEKTRLNECGENPDNYPTRADAERFLAQADEESERRTVADWCDRWSSKGLVLLGDKSNLMIEELHEFDEWAKALAKKGIALPLPAQIHAKQLADHPDLEMYLEDLRETMLNLHESEDIKRKLTQKELVNLFRFYISETWCAPDNCVDSELFLRRHCPEIFLP